MHGRQKGQISRPYSGLYETFTQSKKEKGGKKKRNKKTARKMAQCVEKPVVKPDNLSSKFRIHMVEREPSSQVVL